MNSIRPAATDVGRYAPGDPAAARAAAPPLVVDLDGTLVTGDTLFEGVAAMLAKPWTMLAAPVWLLRGRPAFKREVARRAPLDAATLAYDEQVLALIRAERERRRIVLCTAADHAVGDGVAAHLGLFDEVLATRDGMNLSGAAKARALVERFGEGGFDYVGDSAADLPVFARARRAIVVAPAAAVRRRVAALPNVERVIERPETGGSRLAALARAMRPHQWLKNLLVFVPLLATFDRSDLSGVKPATLAFAAFCLVASAVYLLNDLVDLAADRRHPRKRKRPLASGALPIAYALAAAPALLLLGVLVATRVSALFVAVLALYAAVTSLYTFWLKRVPILDTLLLAGLYTLRILAGAAAIVVVPSTWLLAFSMFFFMSLALAKRHSELVEFEGSDAFGAIPGREYRAADLSTLISQGSASGYAAVLVLALYIDSPEVHARYRHPGIIWLICPVLLYWINKLWLNSQRREIRDDPVIWAVKNRVSRGLAVIGVVLLLLARWLP